MAPDPSPEEILLRLIKEGKSKNGGTPKPAAEFPSHPQPQYPAPAALNNSTIKTPGQPNTMPDDNLSAAAVQESARPVSLDHPVRNGGITGVGRWGDMGRHMESWTRSWFGTLEIVPRLLLAICVTLAAWICFNAFHDRFESRAKLQMFVSAASRPALAAATGCAALAPKPMGEPLPDKDIFKYLDQPVAAAPDNPARVVSLESILSNYSLAGIIGGDQPQAIIEDKRQGKTFTVSVGESLGELRIVSIEEGKVVVAIGEERAELNL